MINVIVSGALGRMGGRIIPQILKSPDLQLTGAIERVGHDHIGQSVAERFVLESDISGLLSGCVVLVEFTTPDATMAHLEQARREGVAVLIGTTGFTEIQEEMLKEASKDIAIIATHNYGFGMNVFWKIVRLLAEYLGDDYDVDLVEHHGRDKPDVPSGTGHTIAEIIAEAKGRVPTDVITYGGTKTAAFTRRSDEIAVHSLRGGAYKSDHAVIFSGDGEILELRHREEDLRIIVRGVMLGIRFLHGRQPGRYKMSDVLEFVRSSEAE